MYTNIQWLKYTNRDALISKLTIHKHYTHIIMHILIFKYVHTHTRMHMHMHAHTHTQITITHRYNRMIHNMWLSEQKPADVACTQSKICFIASANRQWEQYQLPITDLELSIYVSPFRQSWINMVGKQFYGKQTRWHWLVESVLTSWHWLIEAVSMHSLGCSTSFLSLLPPPPFPRMLVQNWCILQKIVENPSKSANTYSLVQ